jgi:signal transduction histidine kinase/ActR/RegA family two-component response regulator
MIGDLEMTINRGLEHRRLIIAEQEARADLERLNRDLENRVDQRTAELRQVNESLTKAHQAKDFFLATLSHELRAPLTPILSWASLLRKAPSDVALVMQGLDSIVRNAKVQTRLIDDLLDMSRIVSGKLHLEMEPTDLCAAIEAAVEIVREKAEARGVSLRLSIGNAPVVVRGAPVRLQQVVWNLLTNAIKFTGEGGFVDVSLRRQGPQAVFVVSDSGVGIAPEFLPHVFDAFSQADISSRRRHGGLGLGLAIVRELTELHGGAVTAYSDGEGRGARFTITLPCAALENISSEERIQPPQQPGLGTVLIVDDQPDTLEMMRILFTQIGCRVLAASSVQEALSLASKEHPRVVISDIGMPEADGYELITRLKRIPGLENVRAIALSGYAMEEDLSRSRAAGFTAHLAKPIDPEDLIARVRALTSE